VTRVLERVRDFVNRRRRWYYRDNRFSSRRRMADSHAPILAVARRVLGERGGAVLDLGCGNGALLAALCDRVPAVVPFGVDRATGHVAHARRLLPRHASNFREGDLFDAPTLFPGRRFAAVLLAPKRLLERGQGGSLALLRWTFRQCDRVIVYAYGKSAATHGGVAGPARVAGLQVFEGEAGARAAIAVSFRDGPPPADFPPGSHDPWSS
jgi:SAM-dependent methyltransferase